MLRPAVPALLGAVLAIRLLVRIRRLRGVPNDRAWRHSVAEVGMVVGTAPWVWMILTPRPGERGLSLVPLQDLADQLSGPVPAAVVQVGGNLLVLAALGFFLPVRFRLVPGSGRRAGSRERAEPGPWPRTVAVLARVAVVLLGVAVTVEVLQYALGLGRVTSVDDVLVNVTGGLLAALCSRRWWADRAPFGGR
ncbi:VanZ family protein [Promicromonospora sp. MEB111]|uniref:VanZ family protein n=1 Tax=Promicromonospora sp. MEB111 TaxID=3040301 RepID=UPI00254B1216|nr:VanZ family protein [Promicromonospora sp. MEB111]